MTNPLRTFASLYSTTLLTVLASGLLTTYLDFAFQPCKCLKSGLVA